MKLHLLLLVLLFWVCNSNAQTYPLRSITTVSAPYPVSLDEFANSESGKVNLTLIPTDASMQNYPVKLRLFIVGNGYKIYSDPNYASRSIMLNHGETQMFTGPELAAWFNPDNLVFEGLSKSQYQKTGRLPEGMVQVWFETWDFYRNFNISGTSKAMVWLFENQPPILTFPVDKKEFPYADPQSITFNWMPGQSPFSVAGLTNLYKYELWEIWPDNLNADAVVQTTQPIYTTTQTTTTLQYGTDCPILQTGRRYAWRIQAYDPEGKKQYKNNGYSAVRTFRFGRDCGIPDFKLDKVTTSKAILSWNTDTRYTAYNLRYRNKSRTTANWYEQKGTFVGSTIEKLQPATQYEVQLQATCYEQQGEWSPSLELRTSQELSFNCGTTASATDISDREPLPTLLHNEYFKAYDFDIEVDEVSGGNGRFSGTGYARVPLLNFVKFRVRYSGISINSSYRMTSGNVTFDYDESNGMTFDLSGILSSLGVGATAESNPFTSIIPNQLSTGEAQATNITFDNNTVVVRQSDGNTVTKTATSSTPFVAVTSTKPGSDSYVADASSGTVYKASSDPGTANGGSLQQPKASDKALSYAVTFAPHVRQLYGFDLPGEKHPEGNYKTQLMGGNNVQIPWKSVETGQIDRVMATLGTEADTAIHFITQSGNIVMVAAGDKSNLQTPASSSNSIFKQLLIAGTQNDDQLKAWYTSPGDTTKKPERVLAAVANVVAYDKQTAPVYIVEINGAVAPDASYIQTYLNTVYAPAIANFTVSKKVFTTSITSPFDNTLTDEMGYNKAQDVLIKAFKNFERIDKNAYYLFFIKETTTHSDIKGHMPFNRSFGFIYAANQSITELTRTMAHELGHGAFRLKHTFSNENNFIQDQGQTPNLMDYASGSELLKYQWDECHDFDLGCNWFEDGDEAASNLGCSVVEMKETTKDGPIDDLLKSYFDFNKTINMSSEIVPKTYTSIDGSRTIPTTYTSQGGARNYIYFWTKMLEKYPQLFDEVNVLKIKKGLAPIANDQWIINNPSHIKWKGEKLEHHHWLQGKKAGALPMPLHRAKGYTKLWHKFKSKGSLGFVALTMLDVVGALNGNPDNIYSYFRTPEINKIYFDYINGSTYFVPYILEKTYDSKGNLVSIKTCYYRYSNYMWDEEQNMYIGTGYIESKCEVYNVKTKSGGFVLEPV